MFLLLKDLKHLHKGRKIKNLKQQKSYKRKKRLFGFGSKKEKRQPPKFVDPLDIADAETLDPNADTETSTPTNSGLYKSYDSSESTDDGSFQGGGGQGMTHHDHSGGIIFTEEASFTHATQDGIDHGAPLSFNARRRHGDSVADSSSYQGMLSDFERLSTQDYASSSIASVTILKLFTT